MADAMEILMNTLDSELIKDSQEDVDMEDFLKEVIDESIVAFVQNGYTLDFNFLPLLEDDLREELRTITQKKIYGYTSIKSYREARSHQIQDKNYRKCS